MNETLEFAKKAHSGQTYKNGVPYWLHLNRVAKLIDVFIKDTGEGTEEDNKILLDGAILHDTLEDTDVSEEDIKNLFGERVLSIVMEMTDQEPNKAESPNYIIQILNSSDEARLVKLADLIDNMTTATRRINENGLEWTKNFFIPRVSEISKEILKTNFSIYKKTSEFLKEHLIISSKLLEDEISQWETMGKTA